MGVPSISYRMCYSFEVTRPPKEILNILRPLFMAETTSFENSLQATPPIQPPETAPKYETKICAEIP